MSRKTTGFLIILLGLIALLVAIYFLFFYKQPQPEKVVVEEKVEVVKPKKEVPKPLPVAKIEKPKKEIIKTEQKKEVTKTEVSQAQLERLAASFAERYGSFSNQSNFQNLKDLMVFMSVDMQERVISYIEVASKQRGDTSNYFGMSTQSLVTNIEKLDNDKGEAVILVKTIRQEATGDINNINKKNQNIRLSFVKENGDWKVDKADWQ